MTLPGCQAVGQAAGQPSSENGPGCPPLPSFSADIYPYSTAAGADKIRVSPGNSTTYASGNATDVFTITACYGPVKWSVSAPSYVSWSARSGTLKTGQEVQVTASWNQPGVTTSLTINPGDYVLGLNYSAG